MSRDEISRKKRQLSEFLCREMMYDYITGRLDDERKQAMDEFLAENSESRQELAALREGLDFCHELSRVEVARPLIERIKQEKGLTARLVESLDWRSWPDIFRWSVEALVLSVVLALIVVLIPWGKILDFQGPERREVILAERLEMQQPAESEEESEPQQAETSASAEPESVAEPEPEPELVAEPEPALKGEIYRAFMNLENVDEVTDAVTARIEALGGKKAGEVELGWRRPQGSYYHFTIPETNHDALLEALGEFGPVRVFKNPHWRVMPEGTIRFILWLERVEPEPESEPESDPNSEGSYGV